MSAMNATPPGTGPLREALLQGADAAAVGFDWPDAAGVLLKVREELGELEEALDQSGGRADAAVEHELGDLLMALASLARKLDVDPERALSQANLRFVARFQEVEAIAAAQGARLEDLSPAALDALWVQAKGRLRAR